jgi:hypothetical protein
MSLPRPKPRPNARDFDQVLKALVHLLARQVARERLTLNPPEKEVDDAEEEDTEDAAQGGDPERAG